jgi:transcriptional regulator GlxA family with amidase domain
MRPRSPGVLVIVEGRTIRLRSRDAIALVSRAVETERSTACVKDSFVARALAAMAEEPARPWTVDSLARGVGLSRAAFAARFRRAMGKTPRAHLTELRLQRAAEHLAATDDALASVAAEVGYASEFSLAKAFKRRFGVPPGVFRREPHRIGIIQSSTPTRASAPIRAAA